MKKSLLLKLVLVVLAAVQFVSGAYDQKCGSGTHCKDGGLCDTSGVCADCDPEYFGPNCQFRRALLLSPPVLKQDKCSENAKHYNFQPYQYGRDTGANKEIGQYMVYRKINESAQQVLLINITSNSFSPTLEYGTYRFAVRADFATSYPGIFELGSTTNLAFSEPIIWPCTLRPLLKVPTNLRVVSITATTATVQWDPPSNPSGIINYEIVYWLVDTQSPDTGTRVTTTGTQILLSGLQRGKQYDVKARASTTEGFTLYSNQVAFNTLSFGVDGSATSTTTARLIWSSTNKPIQKIIATISRKESLSAPSYTFTTINQDVLVSSSSYDLTNLTPAGHFSADLLFTYTDSSSDTMQTTFWTKPGPFVVKAPVEISVEDNRVTVSILPVTGYQEGRITAYYLAVIEDSTVASSRAKRAVAASSVGGLPSNARIVFTSDSLPVSGKQEVIGDNSASVGYTDPGLKSGTGYRVYLVGRSVAGDHTLDQAASLPVTTSGQPVTLWTRLLWLWILLIILAIILFLLLLALLIYCCLRRRRSNQYLTKKQKPLPSKHKVDGPLSVHPRSHLHWSPIANIHDPRYVILDLESDTHWHPDPHACKVPFIKEYDNLPNGMLNHHATAKLSNNLQLNRNPNLVPYDHNRVVLLRHPGDHRSDYINASYIDGYIRRKAYIAAQSPFDKTTVDDFWLMIYQQNIAQIVMLTESVEEGTLKCSQYWPNYHPDDKQRSREHFSHNIHVSLKSEDEYAHWTVRRMVLTVNTSSGEQKRQDVTQYQFHGWPEHGVPSCTLPFLDLYTLVKMNLQIKDGPLLVHCGTGTTRTPIFIALDSLLQQAVHEDVVNVFRFCTKMRKARPCMIRTAHQYMFLYDLLFEGLLATSNIVNLDVRETYKQLCIKNPKTGQTYLWEQFYILHKYCILEDHQSTDASNGGPKGGFRSYNTLASRNRVPSILPSDHYRVRLHGLSDSKSDYINAVWLDGIGKCDDIIITQTPMPATVKHFWAMIEQEQVSYIVDMEMTCYGKVDIPVYFPEQINSELRVTSGLTVRCHKVHRDTESKIIVRHFHLGPPGRQQRQVTLYQLDVSWEQREQVPSDRLALINLIQRVLSDRVSGPLVIHCSDGATRSGFYAASHIACHKITMDSFVDVFHTINALKKRRRQIIVSDEQYKCVYKVLWDWVRTHLTAHLQVALSTHTLRGHLPPAELECIYSHAQSPVLHSHDLSALGDLTALENTGHGHTGHLGHSGHHGHHKKGHHHHSNGDLSPVHYHYKGNTLGMTL